MSPHHGRFDQGPPPPTHLPLAPPPIFFASFFEFAVRHGERPCRAHLHTERRKQLNGARAYRTDLSPIQSDGDWWRIIHPPPAIASRTISWASRNLRRVLSSFNEFYRVLPSFTELYPVLLGFTGFYRVLPSLTEFYRVLPSFTALTIAIVSYAGCTIKVFRHDITSIWVVCNVIRPFHGFP